MTNGNTGGDHGSPSKPTPNPNPNSPRQEENPRRRSGGANAPPASPRRRGSPSSPPKTRPVMGVPGESAFAPYTKPRSEPGGSGGRGVEGGPGLQGAQVVPVGSGGYGVVAAPGALRIGGSPAARKRVRESGAGSTTAAGGNQPGEGAGNVVNCSVCGKGFPSQKALFGHMRSHPDRGWKGAHPPPTFKAEEEFADLHGLNLPEAGRGGDAQEGAADDHQKEDEAAESEEEEEAGDSGKYRLPDLNNPPPPDAN
ncbi:uncharacterized protein LOC105178398 [Sesamum indicum]|uniref:Uncharacterized protein LOC105155299 n=1 Tax=Sesamum indicum TaxID=4182 RepID=A0A6I9UFJ2_SESIN|nr:uncharacterized protein LOC105155299 [Sesamum indicum]XP_011100162.1 uncharacterized protein LOC105178395 [Sesamum indicum]XP_011100164.1 uncharacterized protein LOC105178398 [Sesamum indicum]